ncbi:MAG: Asp-tRNA(Asn)/Glu-tRNA(Gln) amidotransferase subunit GatA, partial [Candidatus Saccharibacteria bacterium]
MEIHELTLRELSDRIKAREISPAEAAKASAERIRATEKDLHAFISVTEERTASDVKVAEQAIAENEDFVLTGIPYAAKDNIMVKGIKATAGSKILEDYVATYDATVIRKLSNLSPLLMGKTNMDEFAMGSSTEYSAFGPTRNPYDLTRVPGGSSGGSAAAVAAGDVFFALGSETGGSVRQPASFCGIAGLKPTYGRVSRYGLMAMGSSVDQIGLFAKTVEDMSLVFEHLAGQDEWDTTSLPKPVPPYSELIGQGIKGFKVGVPKEYFIEGMDPEVKAIIEASIKRFEELGAVVEEMSLPHSSYALAAYYILIPVEVSANLSRYDGIRYGLSVPGESLDEVYRKSRSQGLGKEPKRRIMIGAYASSAGYYDAYYKKAQLVQSLVRKDFTDAFDKYDLLLTPTCPTPAFKIGEKSDPL